MDPEHPLFSLLAGNGYGSSILPAGGGAARRASHDPAAGNATSIHGVPAARTAASTAKFIQQPSTNSSSSSLSTVPSNSGGGPCPAAAASDINKVFAIHDQHQRQRNARTAAADEVTHRSPVVGTTSISQTFCSSSDANGATRHRSIGGHQPESGGSPPQNYLTTRFRPPPSSSSSSSGGPFDHHSSQAVHGGGTALLPRSSSSFAATSGSLGSGVRPRSPSSAGRAVAAAMNSRSATRGDISLHTRDADHGSRRRESSPRPRAGEGGAGSEARRARSDSREKDRHRSIRDGGSRVHMPPPVRGLPSEKWPPPVHHSNHHQSSTSSHHSENHHTTSSSNRGGGRNSSHSSPPTNRNDNADHHHQDRQHYHHNNASPPGSSSEGPRTSTAPIAAGTESRQPPHCSALQQQQQHSQSNSSSASCRSHHHNRDPSPSSSHRDQQGRYRRLDDHATSTTLHNRSSPGRMTRRGRSPRPRTPDRRSPSAVHLASPSSRSRTTATTLNYEEHPSQRHLKKSPYLQHEDGGRTDGASRAADSSSTGAGSGNDSRGRPSSPSSSHRPPASSSAHQRTVGGTSRRSPSGPRARSPLGHSSVSGRNTSPRPHHSRGAPSHRPIHSSPSRRPAPGASSGGGGMSSSSSSHHLSRRPSHGGGGGSSALPSSDRRAGVGSTRDYPISGGARSSGGPSDSSQYAILRELESKVDDVVAENKSLKSIIREQGSILWKVSRILTDRKLQYVSDFSDLMSVAPVVPQYFDEVEADDSVNFDERLFAATAAVTADAEGQATKDDPSNDDCDNSNGSDLNAESKKNESVDTGNAKQQQNYPPSSPSNDRTVLSPPPASSAVDSAETGQSPKMPTTATGSSEMDVVAQQHLANQAAVACGVPRALGSLGNVLIVNALTVAAGGVEHRTIADALSAAVEGSSILVKSGLYLESLLITKPVRIVGVGPDVRLTSDFGDAIVVLADDVVVQNMLIKSEQKGNLSLVSCLHHDTFVLRPPGSPPPPPSGSAAAELQRRIRPNLFLPNFELRWSGCQGARSTYSAYAPLTYHCVAVFGKRFTIEGCDLTSDKGHAIYVSPEQLAQRRRQQLLNHQPAAHHHNDLTTDSTAMMMSSSQTPLSSASTTADSPDAKRRRKGSLPQDDDGDEVVDISLSTATSGGSDGGAKCDTAGAASGHMINGSAAGASSSSGENRSLMTDFGEATCASENVDETQRGGGDVCMVGNTTEGSNMSSVLQLGDAGNSLANEAFFGDGDRRGDTGVRQRTAAGGGDNNNADHHDDDAVVVDGGGPGHQQGGESKIGEVDKNYQPAAEDIQVACPANESDDRDGDTDPRHSTEGGGQELHAAAAVEDEEQVEAAAGQSADTTGLVTCRDCRIHDIAGCGVFATGVCRLLVVNTSIEGCGMAGLEVRDRADVLVSRCKIADCAKSGVFAHSSCIARIISCDVSACGMAGVEVCKTSMAYLRHTRIYRGMKGGLFVHDHARVQAESCEFFANAMSNTDVRSGGCINISHSKLSESKTSGVYVAQSGDAHLLNNHIYRNAGNGIELNGSRLWCIENHVHGNKRCAIFANGECEGLIEKNDLRWNGDASLNAHPKGRLPAEGDSNLVDFGKGSGGQPGGRWYASASATGRCTGNTSGNYNYNSGSYHHHTSGSGAGHRHHHSPRRTEND